MALDIPKEGFTMRQAEDAISSIIQQSVNPDEAPKDEPGADATESSEPVQESADEREDKSAEPTDSEVEEVKDSGESGTDTKTDSDEESAEVEDTPEGGDGEEYEYDHAALAQALGIEEDDLVVDEGRIHVRTKINGEESQASLADLKNSYQMTSAAQKGMQDLAQEKKQFAEERRQKMEDLGKQGELFNQALYAMQQEYLNDFRNINWEQLKAEDPDTYTVKRIEYQDKEKSIQKFYHDYQQAQEQIKKHFYDQMSGVWEEGAKQLNNVFSRSEYKNAPKWDTEEGNRLTTWMIQQGFPAETISTLGAWQVFKWARDSMLREEELKKTKKTMKKVVKLPKVKTSKPGTPASKAQKSRSKLDEAKYRQRKAAKSGQKNFNETVDLISKIIRS